MPIEEKDVAKVAQLAHLELADEEPAPESVELGLFAGLCNTHDAEGLGWKKWWRARDRTLILATYNGPVGSANAEIRVAEELLKTLELRS